MDNKNQLIHALNFAGRAGSFHKRNIIESAENVCIYGLGKYFEDAFLRQDIRNRFNVKMLCDSNEQRLNEVAADTRYSGLQCVMPENIPEHTAVIIMLGDPRSALKQLRLYRNICPTPEDYVNLITYNDAVLDDIMEGSRDRRWFISHEPDILEVFDVLHDEESKRIFVNVLCNRIAPQYSHYEYDELCVLPQYFPEDLFSLKKDESFVDCGAYTGDTIESLLKVTGGLFKGIDAFELDRENFQTMQKCVSKMSRGIASKIRLWPGGVAEHDGIIQYGRMSSSDSYSIYNPRETSSAQVFSLDSTLKDEVSMIKMDIEGAELSALKGAARIIQEQKPKLAICIYHRIEDMWQIPLYLKKLVPEYKISVRHHANWWVSETVCYAYL